MNKSTETINNKNKTTTTTEKNSEIARLSFIVTPKLRRAYKTKLASIGKSIHDDLTEYVLSVVSKSN